MAMRWPSSSTMRPSRSRLTLLSSAIRTWASRAAIRELLQAPGGELEFGAEVRDVRRRVWIEATELDLTGDRCEPKRAEGIGIRLQGVSCALVLCSIAGRGGLAQLRQDVGAAGAESCDEVGHELGSRCRAQFAEDSQIDRFVAHRALFSAGRTCRRASASLSGRMGFET